jgi:hypothetical protein
MPVRLAKSGDVVAEIGSTEPPTVEELAELRALPAAQHH